jgi:hypothetical protein
MNSNALEAELFLTNRNQKTNKKVFRNTKITTNLQLTLSSLFMFSLNLGLS